MLASTPATTPTATLPVNTAAALSADSSWFQTKKDWLSAKTASVPSFDLKSKLPSTPDWFSNRHWAVKGLIALTGVLSFGFLWGSVRAWLKRDSLKISATENTEIKAAAEIKFPVDTSSSSSNLFILKPSVAASSSSTSSSSSDAVASRATYIRLTTSEFKAALAKAQQQQYGYRSSAAWGNWAAAALYKTPFAMRLINRAPTLAQTITTGHDSYIHPKRPTLTLQ